MAPLGKRRENSFRLWEGVSGLPKGQLTGCCSSANAASLLHPDAGHPLLGGCVTPAGDGPTHAVTDEMPNDVNHASPQGNAAPASGVGIRQRSDGFLGKSREVHCQLRSHRQLRVGSVASQTPSPRLLPFAPSCSGLARGRCRCAFGLTVPASPCKARFWFPESASCCPTELGKRAPCAGTGGKQFCCAVGEPWASTLLSRFTSSARGFLRPENWLALRLRHFWR